MVTDYRALQLAIMNQHVTLSMTLHLLAQVAAAAFFLRRVMLPLGMRSTSPNHVLTSVHMFHTSTGHPNQQTLAAGPHCRKENLNCGRLGFPM
jgi:hypothetical protein